MAVTKTTGKSTKGKGKGKGGKPEAVKPAKKKMRVGSGLTFKPVKKFKGLDAECTYATRASDGTARIAWNGHKITGILRFMGHAGANVKQALAWCLALGYTVHPTTVSCQVTSGRAGAEGWTNDDGKKCEGGWRGPLPKFTKEEAAYLKSIRPATTDEGDE